MSIRVGPYKLGVEWDLGLICGTFWSVEVDVI